MHFTYLSISNQDINVNFKFIVLKIIPKHTFHLHPVQSALDTTKNKVFMNDLQPGNNLCENLSSR